MTVVPAVSIGGPPANRDMTNGDETTPVRDYPTREATRLEERGDVTDSEIGEEEL